jgi:LAO/AO transport system kinase
VSTAAAGDPGADAASDPDRGAACDDAAPPHDHVVAELVAGVLAGERRALAKAITLVESTRPDDRPRAEALLAAVLPHAGGSMRIGISGSPGVGKSTFIEAFGARVVDRGSRLAVLAVDPSSSISGGSILGDKTRMEELARRPDVFIRPSPAGRTLGGVARRTREAIVLAEAAGYDLVLVETVGVGQSEIAVDGMVDLFALLVGPGSGDELQGIKRGIMELADLVIVTKADGALAPAARAAAADHAAALRLLRPRSHHWTPEVVLASSVTGEGLDDVHDAVLRFRADGERTGALAARRTRQARAWLWTEISEGLVDRLRADPGRMAMLDRLEAQVEAGEVLPTVAARRVLDG